MYIYICQFIIFQPEWAQLKQRRRLADRLEREGEPIDHLHKTGGKCIIGREGEPIDNLHNTGGKWIIERETTYHSINNFSLSK